MMLPNSPSDVHNEEQSSLQSSTSECLLKTFLIVIHLTGWTGLLTFWYSTWRCSDATGLDGHVRCGECFGSERIATSWRGG